MSIELWYINTKSIIFTLKLISFYFCIIVEYRYTQSNSLRTFTSLVTIFEPIFLHILEYCSSKICYLVSLPYYYIRTFCKLWEINTNLIFNSENINIIYYMGALWTLRNCSHSSKQISGVCYCTTAAACRLLCLCSFIRFYFCQVHTITGENAAVT